MPYKDKEKAKEYQQKNKEYIKERHKKYRQNNKEYIKERQEKWRQNNKEHLRKQGREYYQNNKEGIKKRNKEYYQNNKKHRREYDYKKLYNLTLEEIDQILLAQNHRCLICGKSLMEIKWCIDHNYETGQIRGILCDWCNKGLGHFKDNPEFLRKAALYIESK